jgi:GntR family transcriptional regulator/MocR family aminotransferase
MPKHVVSSQSFWEQLDSRSSEPLHRQLYKRIRAKILSGQLLSGTRLPSTRVLASELGIARTTVTFVYDQLRLEGYLESQTGNGTWVAKHDWVSLPHLSKEQNNKPEISQRSQTACQLAGQYSQYAQSSSSELSFFAVGYPDISQFPYDIWAKFLAKRAKTSLSRYASYQSAGGYLPLREAIASHIGITRGVRCNPEQIIITVGAQGGFDLSARSLLEKDDIVAMEDPGYFGIRGVMQAVQARMIPVPVDNEGLRVAEGKILAPQARFITITPSHQFPTAVTMSLPRRMELLDWAKEANAWIIEDDYDSEFRYSGRPLEALQSLDRDQKVIYVGSFSKVLFPAIRLGYLVVPSPLSDIFLATRRFIDIHPPILEQMALADFMNEGYFARHIRLMRTIYAERRDLLISTLTRELKGYMEISTPEAGMHLVAWFPSGVDDSKIASFLNEAGISIAPLSHYCLTPLVRGGLVFNFATLQPAALDFVVQKIRGVLQKNIRNVSSSNDLEIRNQAQ